jgi:hypothetical protein
MATTESCCPGKEDPTASLVAELGILDLIAHVRWSDPANQQELAVLARRLPDGATRSGYTGARANL